MMTDRPEPASDGGTPPQLETMAERLERLERLLANGPAVPNTAALEEQLAQRVLSQLNERLGSLAALPSGPVPPGFTPPSAAPSVAGLLTAVALSGSSYRGVRSWIPSLSEFSLMARMYFDSRYRTSRLAQFAVPGLLCAMGLNYAFFSFLFIQIPILSPLAERVVLILLAVALYKVLSWEAARYKEVLNYLSRFSGVAA